MVGRGLGYESRTEIKKRDLYRFAHRLDDAHHDSDVVGGLSWRLSCGLGVAQGNAENRGV